MTESTVWWMLAGLAVTMELLTGTFFLLMVAGGLAGGALAAHLGLPLIGQIVVVSVVSGGAVVAWYWRRSKAPKRPAPNANRDMQMDIGATVLVEQWNPDATASVQYRGARWTVVLADNSQAHEPGLFKVEKLSGNRLVLRKV